MIRPLIQPLALPMVSPLDGGMRLNQIAKLAGLATDLTAAAFVIAPEYCFAERSVAATTPVAVGGLVGCLRSVDGRYFAVPGQDSVRPTLRQDDAGHYFIAATGANMLVLNSLSAAFTLATSFTHVGGWRASLAGDNAFCWGRDNLMANRINLGSTANIGSRCAIQTALNVFHYFTSQNSVDVPHVLRFTKTPAAANLYYGAGTSPVSAAAVPWDDSGHVRELGLFTGRTGLVSAFNFNGGRFYGGWWSSADLNATQSAWLCNFYLGRTLPVSSIFGSTAHPTVLDFQNGVFEWDGQSRTLADLTDNGGGSYTLEDGRSWNQDHTLIVDVSTNLASGTWSGTLVEFLSNNVANEKIFVDTQAPTSTRLALATAASQRLQVWRGIVYVESGGYRRTRATFVVPKTGEATGQSQSFAPGSLFSTLSAPALFPDQIRVNTQVTGWQIHRVAIYPKILSTSELAEAYGAGQVSPVHVLGDSFVGWGTADQIVTNLLYSQASVDNPDLIVSADGVGGVGFYEAGGNGHTQRFAATPLQYQKTLVMIDGGFETDRPDAQIHPYIQTVIDALDHGAEKRYLFTESNPINPIGDSRRTRWDAVTAVVKTNHGTRYVETLEAMYCLYLDNANDLADLATGIWPRSTRSDSTHYLEPGRALYAKAALGVLKDFGWVRGTTSLPGVVVSLAAAGTTLTWSPPASDGGHPVMGYSVQRFVGAEWVAQTPQGSPTGYTKQYVRSWVAPAAGTYRVAAITRKGMGSYVEVVVS